jgi:hypothetical protein
MRFRKFLISRIPRKIANFYIFFTGHQKLVFRSNFLIFSKKPEEKSKLSPKNVPEVPKKSSSSAPKPKAGSDEEMETDLISKPEDKKHDVKFKPTEKVPSSRYVHFCL